MIDTAIAALTKSLPGLMTTAIENYEKVQEKKPASDWAKYWGEAVALGVFDGILSRVMAKQLQRLIMSGQGILLPGLRLQ